MARQELSKAALTRLSWVAMIVGVSLILLALLPLRIVYTTGYGWQRVLAFIIGLISIGCGLRWSLEARG